MSPFDLNKKTKEELIDLVSSYQKQLSFGERCHLMLDNMTEGFQVLDKDLRYQYVNSTVASQSKCRKEDLIGRTMMEMFPAIEKTEMYQALLECLQQKENRIIENKFDYPDGESAYFRLSIQPVEEGLLILSMDITDIKKLLQEKEGYIAEVNQLLFKISHEVRQPVCHIMGVAQLLENSLITVEDFEKFAHATKESIQLLDLFTRDITEFVSEMKINADGN